MSAVNAFKAYDIRGRVTDELNESLAARRCSDVGVAAAWSGRALMAAAG